MIHSWLNIQPNSDFSIYNLPFGVYTTADTTTPSIGVAIGDQILDLTDLTNLGLMEGLGIDRSVFFANSLDALMSLGAPARTAVRARLQEILTEGYARRQEVAEHCLYPQSEAIMQLPFHIGDYTDFYASEQHATNVGMMFRDPANALLPNWKHLPVGYHGRSSSITISGTPFYRPKGQVRPNDAEPPFFTPTRALDFELELAIAIGKPNALGHPISTAAAPDHIFGYMLFNDWSARDIQRWEYVPLGPFLAKNFFSSLSPWVVTPEALEPFRVSGPEQVPQVLPYLEYSGLHHFDIQLEVAILPEGATAETVVCRTNARHLYWNFVQQLAHHTVNGCPMRTGDLLASGTISGPEKGTFGSMLELTWGGKNPLTMSDGSERKYIQDGDTVIMRGYAEKDGLRVGFGEVRNKVLPALT